MAKYKIIPSSRTIVHSPISIGHKAEKGVEAIEFDLTAWVETYGSGTLTVIMRRWGDAIPYPIALEIDENNKAVWTLSDIDTAKAGMAYAQLSYIVGETVVKKSDIYTFRVMDSLTGEGDPPEAYESWLENLTHLAAEAMAEVLDIESIVTDKTLTVDGGIADAKATGDALSALEDQFTEETDQLKADLADVSANVYDEIDITDRFVTGYHVNLSGGVGTTAPITSLTSSGGSTVLVIACHTGDKLKITTKGGTSARAWAVLDADAKILSVADTAVQVTDLVLEAEVDGYFAVNANLAYQPFSAVFYTPSKNQVEDIGGNIYAETDITAELKTGGYIDLSGGVGSTVGTTPTGLSSWLSVIKPCKAGDSIILNLHGGSSGRAWALLDKTYKMLSVAGVSVNLSNRVIRAEQDGYFVINANPNFSYSAKCKSSVINALDSKVEGVSNNTEVVLPRKWICTTGFEYNLYKENCLLYGNLRNNAMVKFIAYLNGYYEDYRRFCMSPTVTTNQTPQFGVYKYDLSRRDIAKNLNLIVVDPAILDGLTKNILVIGDSKVNGGRLSYQFKKRCTDAGMTANMLGTIYNQGFNIYTEGRSGWSSEDYMKDEKSVSNAFYNPTTQKFDFTYYMAQQGYTSMDYVFINLGTNDYAGTVNESGTGFIDRFIDNINTMIDSIHAYDSNIKIIVGLAEGVCTSQWSSSSSSYLYELNTRARLLNKASIAEWDNTAMETAKVYVCPIYMSMDMDNDYLMEEIPLSEWDGELNTGKTRFRITDKMHQNSVGYAKNADYMFAILCYIESLS